MGVPTHVPIASVTLGSSASGVTFGSITQGYRDLVLVSSWTAANSGNAQLSVRYNGDSSANYDKIYIVGTGGAASSGGGVGEGFADCGYMQVASATTPVTTVTNIMEYSASDKFKSAISRSSDVVNQEVCYANQWRSTAPITSIRVDCAGNLFNTGTTLSLYGVLA